MASYSDCTDCSKTMCLNCNGNGKTKYNLTLFGITQKMFRECSYCNGFGYLRSCEVCETGYIASDKKYKIKVKPGCAEGDKYSIENNTIVFIIREYKHPRFIRNENDLILHKTISLYEAVSCLKIKCKHLNNKVYSFSTARTIQNEIIYQLDGLGMPFKGKDGYGNLYIKFDIILPTVCKLSQVEQNVIKSVFDITNTENEDHTDCINYCMKQSNENKLDGALIRIIRNF